MGGVGEKRLEGGFAHLSPLNEMVTILKAMIGLFSGP
jgi:hypothetical protein